MCKVRAQAAGKSIAFQAHYNRIESEAEKLGPGLTLQYDMTALLVASHVVRLYWHLRKLCLFLFLFFCLLAF